MRLKTIRLLCDSISKQKYFYTNKLGLKLVNQNEQFFAVQAGGTLLEFEHQPGFIKQGYYHFAFNIVPTLLEAAVIHFLGPRNIPVLKNKNDTYTDFPDWNAKSVYFIDAEENILEFIARYNLDEPTHDATFNIEHIKCISEIGIAVKETQNFAETVKKQMDVQIWRDYGETFKAIGDEHGLLLDVKEGRAWLPTIDHFNGHLPTEVTIEGPGKNFTYEDVYRFKYTNQ
uniref:Glyoxalase domain-containing protein 4 n=1 Tax=Acrobeloides nanus TaxID=290746 RepID=A0A914C2R7_9BILA